MTEDVVKKALDRVGFPNELLAPMAAAVLQHILDAGPDERMFEKPIGVRALIDGGLLWDTAESNLLSHLIERLQEQK